ncbi:type VI secretion protein IcmF/TssM N-terminal domain-containing protein [Vibrio maritimus]
MKKRNKAIILSSLIAVVVTSLLLLCFWLLGWFGAEPAWIVVLQTLGALAVLIGSCLGSFRLFTRERVNEDDKKLELWRAEEIKRTFNLVWKKHSKLTANPYSIPWYVQLTEDPSHDQSLLQQMGFELIDPVDELPTDLVAVRFWASDSAIIVTIDLMMSKDSVTKSVQSLLELLKKKRARQIFNGALCSVNLGSLLNSTEISSSEISQKYRSMLEDLNKQTGLVLPVYCAFTDMAQVKDLCELFSPLDETERDQPFGALIDVNESRHYEKQWFDDSFEALVKGIASSISASLKHQLNADYRDSSVAGLFQLSALRYDIEDFLSLTFNQHQFDDVELFFRGYFFVNTGGDSKTLDVVSAMHASDLGFDSISTVQTSSKTLSLFAKGLFPNLVLKESELVGVNKKRELTYRTTRLVATVGLVVLFAGFLAMIRASYIYQQSLDDKAQAMLSQYKDNLRVNKIQPDDLASPVFSLYELREIDQLYKQDNRPWYVLSWLPSSSIAQYVNEAYYSELTSELLTLMRDYLMKDMFVYNSLDDKVKTLELLNLQQILYNPNRHSSEPLVNYYINALDEEGSGYANLIERFTLLAKDALNTKSVPPAFDPQLLELVRGTLSSNDVSELLYQHIMQHKDFSRRVDLRSQLNPTYDQVFNFKQDFSGYLIPYAFTRDGFEELSNETGFQLASEAIKAYEGVMGRISGDAEMNRINRQLRERYIKDYIRYWSAFTSSVSLTTVDSWGGSEQQLALVTDPNFSPLLQFYQVIDENTNLLKSLVAKETPTEENAQQKDTDTAKEESPLTPANGAAMERVAESITYPFRHVHSVIAANKTGKSLYDVAIADLLALRDWIAKSKEVQFKGHYFLEQLKNTDTSNPVAKLNSAADNYNVPILPELMQQQATLVNGLALDSVREVINQDWSKVSDFYQTRLANHYPFSPLSTTDAALSDVESFFKPNGQFDQFASKYANQLDITISKELFINGFVPHQYLSLSWQYQPFKESVSRIQKQLFTGDKLGFKFSVKAEQMSPVLTRFALITNTKLFEYQNGPKLWRAQAWPIPTNQVQDISVLIEDTSGVIKRDKQSGVWSWFKVADSMHGASQVGSSELIWRYQVGDNEVNLVVKSDGVGQPFDSSFFKQLTLPQWL